MDDFREGYALGLGVAALIAECMAEGYALAEKPAPASVAVLRSLARALRGSEAAAREGES